MEASYLRTPLGPNHVKFLLLALVRMPCSGDEVAANLEMRKLLSSILQALEPPKAKAPAKAPKGKAAKVPSEPENRAKRRREAKAAKG